MLSWEKKELRRVKKQGQHKDSAVIQVHKRPFGAQRKEQLSKCRSQGKLTAERFEAGCEVK